MSNDNTKGAKIPKPEGEEVEILQAINISLLVDDNVVPLKKDSDAEKPV